MKRLIVAPLILVAVGLMSCGGSGETPQRDDAQHNGVDGTDPATPSAEESKLLLQGLPFDPSTVDWSLVMQHADLYVGGKPISDYGDIDGAGTENERRNPQPTFFLPLGTVVLAPVDGVVLQVPQLYSGDYSIHFVRSLDDNDVAWETEHVENVLVKRGDVVKAGQPVATVSDYMCFYSRDTFGNDRFCGTGIGLVELGYLVGGAVPKHLCPFGELTAPSALARIESELSAMRAEIERLAGTTLFDPSQWAATNCVIAEPIKG